MKKRNRAITFIASIALLVQSVLGVGIAIHAEEVKPANSTKVTSIVTVAGVEKPNNATININTDKALSGHVLIQASTEEELQELRTQVRELILINGVSVDEVCTAAGHDYGVYVHTGESGLICQLDQPDKTGDFKIDADATLEIKEGLVVDGIAIEPVKAVFSADTGEWTLVEDWPSGGQTPVAKVTSVVTSVADNHSVLEINTDKALSELYQIQASDDAELKAQAQELILINGVSIGEAIGQAGHNYVVWLSSGEKGLNCYIDQPDKFGNFTVGADATLEIKEGLVVDGIAIEPVKAVFSADTGEWTLVEDWPSGGQTPGGETPGGEATTTKVTSVVTSVANDHPALEINTDKSLFPEIANMQASEDAELKAQVRELILINGVSIGEACTKVEHDYAVWLSTRETGLYCYIDQPTAFGNFKVGADATLEIKEGLVVNGIAIEPVKAVFSADTEAWTLVEDWPSGGQTPGGETPGGEATTTKVTSVVTSVANDHPALEINTDKSLFPEIANMQASEDEELKAQVRELILINGVSIGEACTKVEHDYAVWLSTRETGLYCYIDQPTAFGNFKVGADATLEIKEGLVVNGIAIEPMKAVFSAETEEWTLVEDWPSGGETPDDEATTTKVTSVVTSVANDHPALEINTDKSLFPEIANMQASEDAELKAQVRELILINGVSIGTACEKSGHDYAVWLSTRETGLYCYIDQPDKFGNFKVGADATLEIKEGLVVNGIAIEPMKAVFSAETGEWTLVEEWPSNGEAPEDDKTAHITAIRMREEVQGSNRFVVIDIDTTKPMAIESIGNLQLSDDAAIKKMIRNNLLINGMSVGKACALAGHDYAAMVNATPDGFIIWLDGNNVFGLSVGIDAELEIREGITLNGYELAAAKFSYDGELGTWSEDSPQTGVSVAWGMAAAGLLAAAALLFVLGSCKAAGVRRGH